MRNKYYGLKNVKTHAVNKQRCLFGVYIIQKQNSDFSLNLD